MELKPCPFCGSEPDGPHPLQYNDILTTYFWIECSNAACRAYIELPEPEIFSRIAWNKRI